ncbi:unnamed protein product [Oikopleura dioica]|uniref:Cilia- and flagella-associated protein HOATZ n=1 Tax=Oikopleura dioica TaxID=34765 RepID=E4XCQ9_OIKDI|nr:unnamed protein product [Oikopleura dioica]CBY37473.1 unnamed protein product [Oikopleura dioica]
MSSVSSVEMADCNQREVDFTKMFWKSFSLSPPIESELYQPDILQRQRTATPAGRKSSSRMSRHEMKSARSLHLVQIRSYQKEVAEEEERKKLVSENRLRARELLENHRKNRVYAELVSSRVNRRFFTSEKKPTNEREVDEVQKLDFFKSKSTLI